MADENSEIKIVQRLKDRAARLLAMRDHSEQELRNKLLRTDSKDEGWTITGSQVESVIEWCYEHRWLDDMRFAERYIASRARKGYGPQRISQELSQKGVARATVHDALAASEADWEAAAYDQAERKFGLPLPKQFTEKAKLQRFLLYRGYTMEDIQNLYRNFSD